MVAVIVDSAGRVEAASRTVLGATGDARVVRVVCEYLATATLDWRGRTPRRTVAIIPSIFYNSAVPRGEMPDMPQPPAMIGDTPFNLGVLVPRLRALTREQREQWFADQQPCASFQAK